MPAERACARAVERLHVRRLVYILARPADANNEAKHSRVAIDIESQSDRLVRLTVSHEDLKRDPQMLASISGGWPKVPSNLKALLETGRALPKSPAAD